MLPSDRIPSLVWEHVGVRVTLYSGQRYESKRIGRAVERVGQVRDTAAMMPLCFGVPQLDGPTRLCERSPAPVAHPTACRSPAAQQRVMMMLLAATVLIGEIRR